MICLLNWIFWIPFHLLCRIYSEITPSAISVYARSTPYCPCKEEYRMWFLQIWERELNSKYIYIYNWNASIAICDTSLYSLFEKYFWQLLMSKGKSPKSKVWSCIWDRTQGKFDGLNNLMNNNFTHINSTLSQISLDQILIHILTFPNFRWFKLWFKIHIMLIFNSSSILTTYFNRFETKDQR